MDIFLIHLFVLINLGVFFSTSRQKAIKMRKENNKYISKLDDALSPISMVEQGHTAYNGKLEPGGIKGIYSKDENILFHQNRKLYKAVQKIKKIKDQVALLQKISADIDDSEVSINEKHNAKLSEINATITDELNGIEKSYEKLEQFDYEQFIWLCSVTCTILAPIAKKILCLKNTKTTSYNNRRKQRRTTIVENKENNENKTTNITQ